MTPKYIRRKMKQLNAKRPHQCLKVLELVGFAGYPLDFKLVLYLLSKAVSLEKIVIDPRHLDASDWLDGDYDEWLDGDYDEKLTARAHARQLETILPRGVELVIL